MINYIGITKISTLSLNSDSKQDLSSTTQSYLRWRNKMLVVNANGDPSPSKVDIVALKSEWWLINCLQKSPIKRILVAPQLGGVELANWALAGKRTNKSVYLRTRSDLNLTNLQHTLAWRLKRLFDILVAGLLLLCLSPLGLAIALKRQLSGNQIWQTTWCVGRRGLVFELFGWAENKADGSGNRQLSRFGLHKLPQLINVLRGDMSLVGHYPFSLAETLHLTAQQRRVLNTVPGVISNTPWRSPKFDLRAMSQKSYQYLLNWSLVSDLKILLLVIPRLLKNNPASSKIIEY